MTTNYRQISKKVNIPFSPASSLGLIMPFHPSMWNDRSIESGLNLAIYFIEKELYIKHSIEDASAILSRVKNVFKALNFNSHCKSVAVILSPDSTKVLYLNYPVTLFVSTCNLISILDLLPHIMLETSFYLLFICNGNIRLCEYYHKQLIIVHEHKLNEERKELVDIVVNVFSIISLMNKNCQKPIFIIGNNKQINDFKSIVTYPEIIFKIKNIGLHNTAESVDIIVTEIIQKWSYWVSKFHIGRINLARKNNTIISNYKKVVNALNNSVNGLILLDRKLISKMTKYKLENNYSNESELFINQIEKFIERGNYVVINEKPLLKGLGGIFLLPNT